MFWQVECYAIWSLQFVIKYKEKTNMQTKCQIPPEQLHISHIFHILWLLQVKLPMGVFCGYKLQESGYVFMLIT